MSRTIIAILLILNTFAFSQDEVEKLNIKGNDLAKEGKLKEAIPYYTKAISLDPNYAEPYYNRGKAKINLRDYKGAIEDLSYAIKLDPQNADSYNNRGIAKKKMGDVKGAILDYNLALKCDATLFRVYFNRGIAKFELGDEKGACSDFKIAVKHNVPKSLDALKQAGCN